MIKLNKNKTQGIEKPALGVDDCLSIIRTNLTSEELQQLARAVKEVKKNPVQWAFLKSYISKY